MQIFFLFIGREPTTWPASNCLQIMVFSCAMSSNWVWLQIIFCSKWNLTFLLFAITLAWKWQIASPLEDVHSRWSNDKTIMSSQDYSSKRNVVPRMVVLWVKWWKRELTVVRKKECCKNPPGFSLRSQFSVPVLWKKKVVIHETVDNNCKTF